MNISSSTEMSSLLFFDSDTPSACSGVVHSEPACFVNCSRIVELRIYQQAPPATPSTEAYYLVHELTVAGIEESFAIAPLVDATSHNQGSSRMLPLTTLSRYEDGAPTSGIWLNLSGTRTQGDDTIAYGQVLYYHPTAHHLSVKLTWTSPTGDTPVWKSVTGSKLPDLVVNQTVGMEPRFEIYQVKPLAFTRSPIQLEPISLAAPAMEDGQYDNALLLARNRLWSTSLAWLRSIKRRSSQSWTSAAGAQMALIQWHAQATAAQADSSWASPGQQILANLLDGRWERATTVFTASALASQETVSVLKADRGRLRDRVKTALRVSNNLDIKIWGALLVAAQQSQKDAIVWLQQQPKTTPQAISRVQALLQRLDPNYEEPQPDDVKPSPEAQPSSNSPQPSPPPQ